MLNINSLLIVIVSKYSSSYNKLSIAVYSSHNLLFGAEAKFQGRYTAFLILSVFAAVSGGSFQFGYHLGNVNVPQKVANKTKYCTFLHPTY